MRYSNRSERQLRERAITGLMDLADAGQRTVEIRQVLGWLGVEWREPRAQNTPGTILPGADPMTGCKPVTPGG